MNNLMDAQAKINQAIDLIRPEAKELVDMALHNNSTKDGYGLVMGLLSRFPDKPTQKIFLLALIQEGYPKDTAHQIADIMGL